MWISKRDLEQLQDRIRLLEKELRLTNERITSLRQDQTIAFANARYPEFAHHNLDVAGAVRHLLKHLNLHFESVTEQAHWKLVDGVLPKTTAQTNSSGDPEKGG